jgi:Fe2+ transport system protein FeoA
MNIRIPFRSKKANAEPCTLCEARCNERLRVLCVKEDCPVRSRLHELGFCASVEFKKVADGSALICHLFGTRVAIGRELGAHVVVETVR